MEGDARVTDWARRVMDEVDGALPQHPGTAPKNVPQGIYADDGYGALPPDPSLCWDCDDADDVETLTEAELRVAAMSPAEIAELPTADEVFRDMTAEQYLVVDAAIAAAQKERRAVISVGQGSLLYNLRDARTGFATENVVPVTTAEQDATLEWIEAIHWATGEDVR